MFPRSGAAGITGVKAKLQRVWQYAKKKHPASFYSSSFNPQRVLKNTFLLKDHAGAQRAILRRVSLRGKRPRTKLGHQWRSKRALMALIRSLKGLGRFQASNFWRYYSRRFKTYPRRQNNSFVDTGPGARTGLNLLWPVSFSTFSVVIFPSKWRLLKGSKQFSN